MRDSAFTLGHPKMEASLVRLGFTVWLSAARIPLYVISCLEHKVVVWMYSRQMTRLEQ